MQILLKLLLALGTALGGLDGGAIRREVTAWHLHHAAQELPDVTHPELVDAFVDVALELQTPRVPAALIVALSWGESRFDASAQPACGVMQVFPRDLGEPQAACAEWRRDPRAGVHAGVKEIEMMLADKRVRGDMRWALTYRACGNKAFDGSCSAAKLAWVAAAMARWAALAARPRRELVPAS